VDVLVRSNCGGRVRIIALVPGARGRARHPRRRADLASAATGPPSARAAAVMTATRSLLAPLARGGSGRFNMHGCVTPRVRSS